MGPLCGLRLGQKCLPDPQQQQSFTFPNYVYHLFMFLVYGSLSINKLLTEGIFSLFNLGDREVEAITGEIDLLLHRLPLLSLRINLGDIRSRSSRPPDPIVKWPFMAVAGLVSGLVCVPVWITARPLPLVATDESSLSSTMRIIISIHRHMIYRYLH